MNHSERVSNERKHIQFIYTDSMYRSGPDLQYSSRFLPSEMVQSSPNESSEKIFGNSARFYKALKDYQQTSDVNILKEELWASRKEITSLEKRLLEKTEDIRELQGKKKQDFDSKNLEIGRRRISESSNEINKEREKTTEKARELRRVNELAMNKCKHLMEYYVKKIVFDWEESQSRLLEKVNENENKVIGFFQMVYRLKQKENAKENCDEVQGLMKENKRIREDLALAEKNNGKLAGEIQGFVGKIKEFEGQIKILTKENKLLYELSEEMEKEHKKFKSVHDQQTIKILKLKSSLMKVENQKHSAIKIAKNFSQNEENSIRVNEKYKFYKKKCKKLVAEEKKIKAEYKECEVIAK